MLGVVVKSTGSWYRVRLDDGTYHQSRIKGKFRIGGLKSTNPISVGDRVKLSLEGNDYLINEILQRKNYIIRKSVNLSKQVHIIASNIDQAFLIVTLVSPFTSRKSKPFAKPFSTIKSFFNSSSISKLFSS